MFVGQFYLRCTFHWRMIVIVIPGCPPLPTTIMIIIRFLEAETIHLVHEKRYFSSTNIIPVVRACKERGTARIGDERSSSIEVWRRSIAAMASHSSITYVSGKQLQGLQGPKIAVVDVRDDERAFDGHIAGSMHFSSGSFEEKLPKLVEEVKNKDTVVFHCSFSQVRGPTCARILNEHLNTAVAEGKLAKVPNIVVLERGFNGWAESGRPVCSCQDLVCTHTA